MHEAVSNHATRIKKGRVFDITVENVTLPNGVTLDMDIIRHPGAAAIVPVTEDRSVVLLKQYRHAVGAHIWEIPAGTLEPGEDAHRCARRELTEETGFVADNLEKLGEITPLPAYSDERIHIYLATGLHEADQNLDADELLSVHRIDLRQALEMVQSGEIQDAKTLSGLYLAAARMERVKAA